MVNEVSIPNLRNYEVSIWTLQDRFLSVLKWFSLEQKGQIQEPQITLKDDGTQEFRFSIPKFYKVGNDTVLNPMWHQIDETPLVANMHKLKVIFNKNIGQEIIDDLDNFIIKLNNLLLDLFYRPFNYTVEDFKDKNVNEILLIIEAAITDLPNANSKFLRLKRELNLEEVVLEFLVISVTENHSEDNIMIDVTAEGLAFHELGKIGYKIVLSPDDFLNESEEWFKGKVATEEPQQDIHYWNKKIFGEDDNLITNWKYRVDMDWSSHSHADQRRSDQVYEDEYVSSWQAQDNEMVARYVEGLRVKWRSIDVKESNIYNITQTIAETFGVFCRYEYEHDVNYQITGRTVVYYNNYVRDKQNHFDLTYPYSSSAIQRTIDASNITTKLFVRAIDSDAQGAESITIMDVDANKSKEDYLLNFDYLHKIGTITDEQYEEVSKYEARLFTINSKIHFLRERIDLVEAQKLVWEAKQKTASDALQLDKDREQAARDAKSALTDDEGEIPYEKTFAAIPASDREGYYYISAPVKGIKEHTIHIFSEYDMAKKKPKQESEIFNYSIVRDEFGEVSKIGFSASELRSGWLVCKYDPHLYYDTVITTWVNRAILDARDQKQATDELVKLNYWLYGTLVGFARADYSYTDNEYMEAGYCDGLVRVDTNEVVFSQVGNCRAVPESMEKDPNTGLVDMTDINNTLATPNLYYNLNYYLNSKQQIINAFNRMMGPALREGYWQPENYNDYGDVYKDKFLLYPHQDGINRYLTTYEKPDENGHVSFIWDWKEQYDNEEPFIYQSTIDGKMEQYIAINLTSYMDIIKEHTKDLTFFYYDIGVLETIYGIQEQIKHDVANLYTNTENQSTAPVDINALKSAVNSFNQNDFHKFSITNYRNYVKAIIKFQEIINTINPSDISQINTVLSSIPIKTLEEVKAGIPIFISNEKGFQADIKRYQTSIKNAEDQKQTINLLYDLLSKSMRDMGLINQEIPNIIHREDPRLIEAQKRANDFLHSYNNQRGTSKYIIYFVTKQVVNTKEDGTQVGTIVLNISSRINEFDTYKSECELEIVRLTNICQQLNVINNQIDIIIARRNSIQLEVRYEWIQSLVNNGLRTLAVGSQCELGWIIDSNTMLNNDGDVISEPIPVLILTDAKNLDDNTRQYLATGQFNYEYYTGDEVNGIEYHTLPLNVYTNMPEYQSFIGYYDIVEDGNQNVQEVTPTNLFNINYEDVIYSTIEPQNQLYPTFSEYRYRKVYPRLYFDTLKLKNDSSELYIQLNGKNLTNNEDYYTLSDDRSEGLNVIGLGYYTTLKPHTLYQFGQKQIIIDLLYSLSNVDVAIYLDAIVVMKENAFPKVSYNVELSVLNPEIIQNAYNCLTQIVSINDIELQLEDVNGYISSIVMSLDKAWEDQVEIKNYETKFEDLFSTIVAQTEAMKKSENGLNTAISAFTANGLIKPYILQNSMRTANLQQLYYGGTLSISEKDGIIATADNNAGVIAIRGNGIFTATEQDANGEWKWNTGILPSGINANLITTGQLDTNLIRIYSGDDLSFQWDGDGLYAYRSLYDNRILNENDEYQEVNDTINSASTRQESLNSGTLDYKQYVKYDGTGLTLIAEEGVFIPKKRTNHSDGTQTYIYDEQLETTVERVKISWDGLILRNWAGERTFYADPDTGDLTLIGKITANSGSIAGWTILSDSLQKEGIGLYSDTQDYGPGIVLSDQQLQTIETVIGDTPYYTYKDKSDTNQKYYLNRSSTTEITLYSNDIVYKYQQEIVSVEPKYQVSAANVQSGTQSENNVADGVTISNTASSVNTVIYVGENSTTPMKYNNEPIVYDFNNIPDQTRNDWYNKVRQVAGSAYKNYVNEIEGYNYIPITVQNLPGNDANSTLILQPDITGKPTFSVYARDGATTIRKGSIGNFIIEDNALRGGTLLGTKIDNSSYFIANGSTERFDRLFYDIQADSVNGVLTLTRINGEQVNFNIAAMQAYRNAIAAASQISLTLTSQDGIVIATATNSKGVTVTKQVNISDVGSGTITAIAESGNGVKVTKSITVEYGGVPDIGTTPTGCSGCTDQCKGGCGYSCQKTCAKNCVGSCGDECTTGCGDDCRQHCSLECRNNCTSCGNGCSPGCGGTCSTGCGGECGGCTNKCTGSAKGTCGYSCAMNTMF